MVKKLLYTISFLVAIVCVFTACNNGKSTHTHAYGEWEITKVATCTAEGGKERYCSCGKKQTATIATTSHIYASGICTYCGAKENESLVENPNEAKYNAALNHLQNGEYMNAYTIFEELGDYKDAKQYLGRFHYVPIKITETADWTITTESFTISLGANNLPKTIVKIHDGEYGRYEDTYEYTYDSNNNVTMIVVTDDEGDVSTIVYEYNTSGRIIKENRNGSITTYTYDYKGNLTREEGEYSGKTYSYDAKNNLVKESSDYGYTTYTYDSNNRITQSIYYKDEERVLSSTEYLYDSNGNLIKEVMTNVSGITYPIGAKITTSYVYDTKGNLIEKTDGNGWKTEYEYTFVYISTDITDEYITSLIANIV